jgi:hypothetical protein
LPSLIFIDADSGELLQKNAVKALESGDIERELFPWADINFD